MTEDPKSPRQTALTVAAVLLAIGVLNAYRHRPPAYYCFTTAGVILLGIALFSPASARRFHVMWMRLAEALGYVNSRILLTLMHGLILTPCGFVLRLCGHDPLQMRGGPASSYWIPRADTRQSKDRFERLF